MVIYRHKDKYCISEMCRFFNVSRSGYYDYVKRMDIPAKDLSLAEKIRECQDRCGKTYGSRRVHIWLERNGIYRNPKTVLRVMQKYNLLSVVRRRRFYKYTEHLHRYNTFGNKISKLTDLIKNGQQTSHTYTPNKEFCFSPSLEIYMTTVLLHTRPELSKP